MRSTFRRQKPAHRRYWPKSPVGEYLVSNDANIDDEKTIWINVDSEFNRLAIDRYPHRRSWRLAWLDGGAAFLQSFGVVSNLADPLADIGRLSGDRTQDWDLGSLGRSPGGLVYAFGREQSTKGR